jgi:hypothetical protein
VRSVPDNQGRFTVFEWIENRPQVQGIAITKPRLPHPTEVDAHLLLRLLVVEGTFPFTFFLLRFLAIISFLDDRGLGLLLVSFLL